MADKIRVDSEQRNILKVESGRIVDVNPIKWTVDVYLYQREAQLNGIPYLALYLSSYRGEGVFVSPEVGAEVQVVTPSDGARDMPPFILGYSSSFGDDGSYASHRPELNPGDIFLGTRNGNKIILRRGGVIQIGSTEMAQRLYIPIRNVIKDLAENYELSTVAGDMLWTVDRQHNANKAPTTLVMGIRETSADSGYVVKIEAGKSVGSTTKDKPIVLSVSTYSQDSPKTYTFAMDVSKTGEVIVEGKSSASLKIAKDLYMEVGNHFNVKANALTVDVDNNITLNAKNNLTIKVGGAKIKVDAVGNITIKGKTSITLDAASISAGGNLPLLTNAYLAHTHSLTGLITGYTGPSVPAGVSSTIKLTGG